MPCRARHFLLSLLAALAICLSAFGQGQALAGGAADAIEVVLCVDGEARTVLIDAHGQPVAPGSACAHDPCPDCVPAKAGALPPPTAVPGMRLARSRNAIRPFRNRRPCHRPRAAQPRAPPTKA